MELLEGIMSRRSVREFTAEPVARELLLTLLEAGHWAPSGLNNQPWRFVIVRDAQLRERLAGLTRYGRIVRGAPALLAVFLDRAASYSELKDLQGIGACLQNILLAAHAQGIGAVWLGEILSQSAQVEKLLQVPPDHALMALVAVGHPAHRRQESQRRPLAEVILGEF
jgi:nitroreductase